MDFTTILSEARRYSKTNSTSYPTSEVTQSANKALDRTVALIREAEGRWQWDDTNNTDYPSASGSLIVDRKPYVLDPTHYQIERVEVKDEGGSWHKLKPIDQADLYNQAITDFLATSGTPQYYDKVGDSIFLYPAASYSQTSSLRVYYERGPSYFIITDTTKTPGFNPLFHSIIPLSCAYDYAYINQLVIANALQIDILKLEDQLSEYYARRDKDEHIRLQTRQLNYR